jgi:hypothetical protein
MCVIQNCLQGDAILPLLFNIALEYSIRKVKEEEDQGRLERNGTLVSVKTSNIGH